MAGVAPDMTIDRAGFLAGAAAGLAALAVPLRANAATTLKARWMGGGVLELSSADDSTIVLIDAWIWNNSGYARFGLTKPADLASAAAYVASIKRRAPKTFVIALTHDHGDHMGDYFELMKTLVAENVPFMSAGQSDLMRTGLIPNFKAAGLDESKLIVNNGAGINFGGSATVGPVTLHLVPAQHSTSLGYPAAGFVIDMAGTRVYASGDTAVFGDMALIGRQFSPQLAIVCAGGGPYTMDAEGAADAVRMVGATEAIPVHYGHNPLVGGPETGERFKAALARIAPNAHATVMTPGGRATITLG